MAGYDASAARAENYGLTPASCRDPAIPVQIARATQQAEMMRQQLEELQMRLAPLMGPDLPTLKGGDNAKQPPGCEVAEKLSHLVDMIDGGNAILANMARRLEI